jgi:hypothetical protein
MSVEIFGGRMNHKVCSKKQRSLQDGRQEGVVDDHFCADLPCASRNRANVYDPHQWIAGRFHQNHRRLCRERRFELLQVILVDEHDIEVLELFAGREKSVRTAITVVRGDHQIQRPQLAENEVDRSHARRDDDAALSALELGQRFRQKLPARIGGSRVVMRAGAVECLEGIRRRQVKRRGNRAECRVCCDAVARRCRSWVAFSHANLSVEMTAKEICPTSGVYT